MTKKEFVLTALEEVEPDPNIENLIEFWESQYNLYVNGWRGPEIIDYTRMKFQQFE